MRHAEALQIAFSRPTQRLPGMRRNRGRWAVAVSTALKDNPKILRDRCRTSAFCYLNSRWWYLPKQIKLVLTLRQSRWIDYTRLYS
jgi:hypothetical protein